MQQSLFLPAAINFDLPNAELNYYPDFIENHQQHYQQLLGELNWRQDTISMYGKKLLIPRLSAWYGDSAAAYSYSGIRLEPLAWAEPLLDLKSRLEHELQQPFNSVLANYYRDGQDGVSWHSDDEAELGTNPLIASLSFGATRRFSLRHKTLVTDQSSLSLDLEAGSLLLMAGETQAFWQHQVAKTARKVGGRINLTFRQIMSSA